MVVFETILSANIGQSDTHDFKGLFKVNIKNKTIILFSFQGGGYIHTKLLFLQFYL